MIYREYGKTGKKVSVLGFGGMRFQEDEPIEKSAEIVIRAVELGVNYLDTAPFYCNDRSEDIMGLALQQIDKPVFISTKCNENDGDKVRRSLERSLTRLKVEKIDFFHLWCVLNMKRLEKARQGGAIDAFLLAKQEGLIDHFVISSHQPADEIVQIVNTGIFEGITLGANMINFPFRREGIKEAHNAGMGVVTMNPLSGGLIPKNPNRFDFIRKQNDLSVAASALRFNMMHPKIAVALSGMSIINEVEENVEAVNDLPDLSQEQINKLEYQVEEGIHDLCTGCSSCLPCEKDIPIPKFMDAYNIHILKQNNKSVGGRIKYHWGLDISLVDVCNGCMACEEACKQHIPILDRLKKLKQIVGIQADDQL